MLNRYNNFNYIDNRGKTKRLTKRDIRYDQTEASSGKSKQAIIKYDLEVPKYINIDGYLKDPLRVRSNHVRNSKSIYH